ncbi:MAG TPA: dihydrofolate reductase family protein [Chitinophagaceae bacterium]|jgi:dihydrofolate reductase|nr:dihydrofolate reductase family protein [Chitinophagaceae bacterium]
MRKLSVFNFVTLNGFYKGPSEDISWHQHAAAGSEESEFGKEGTQQDNIILFGRVTYEMMKSYWPTSMANEQNPVIAEGMNKAMKIVFSKKLKNADWENAQVINEDLVGYVKKLKQTATKDMIILGSGSITTQLTDAGLIDQYQFMIDPVAIGSGTAMFNGIKKKLDLELIGSRIFKSGIVLLTYQPLGK